MILTRLSLLLHNTVCCLKCTFILFVYQFEENVLLCIKRDLVIRVNEYKNRQFGAFILFS